MANKTVMIMAGGTGGHIFPALAVADVLKARGWQVIWLGAEGGMETRLVPQHGYAIETVRIAGMRKNGLKRWLQLPFMMAGALARTTGVILRHRPDIAVGFGGYTGFPGGLMSRLLWKPLVIHEQNSVAGLTNRLLSKIASRTLFAFPGAFPGRDGRVGNPVRPEIAAVAEPDSRFAGREGALRLLVVGGSLGAKVLNDTLPLALAQMAADARPHVVHQAGVKQIEALKAAYAAAGVEADCRAFIDDMAGEYAAADLVICRAGALTVAELAAAGVASMLVPLPTAVDDHQTGNARFLADAGAAKLVPQSTLTPAGLAAVLQNMTRAECLDMARRARSLAIVDAAARVADVCETLTRE
ncbi:MAG: undecaprenyldiphospho-muramoylpentapeptide beta-N-acetylglucosaminyltransferase [Paludibacterium sp.]|uniref:undecaprenyldiphospho-muramoylpentapeptide beta-N-acetylglucosaminyltransferase n=1 Tax=Paludibacterium sp. TaxID=1917523 RepID=UPI0025FBF9E8|nr:undecaprenyldiphospho-muramoylpentapeptide beta-N-acetylglucosaminyltransferase [Paludibacterium sp.]MBV8048337.1 undecaprenyldiphospho-muramoylpentapeptide beta-N-acetylglucosaminyltransferase [Paludibacterium sp.]MBV8649386.1 undecaprenyldiphospho-muramoylpentapeptide beta-N-acetylglucosaminyltransferase [Paludibacterium sp.]